MRLHRLLFISLLVFIGFSCKNELPLGGDTLPFKSIISVDTLPITGLANYQYNDYSGNFAYLTIGKTTDPAVGDISVSTLFLPDLLSFNTAIDTISLDAKYRLKLVLANTFGDTLAANNWTIYKINKYWRANTWRYDSVATLDPAPLKTKLVEASADTFYVDLPDSFAADYKNYYYQFTGSEINDVRSRDSLYLANMFGFSIVADQVGSLKMFNLANFKMEIVESDTVYTVPMVKSANSYSLQNPVDYSLSEHSVINSFNSQFITFDLDIKNNDSLSINNQTIGSKYLAKVEIVFYEDSTLINSQRPASFRNTGINQLLVYETNDEGLSDEILLNRPTFVGSRTKKSYKMNITSYINSYIVSSRPSDNKKFYLSLRGNDGFFTNNILFNDKSSVYYPRLILTYAKTEVNK